jgi:hypothetical protein
VRVRVGVGARVGARFRVQKTPLKMVSRKAECDATW